VKAEEAQFFISQYYQPIFSMKYLQTIDSRRKPWDIKAQRGPVFVKPLIAVVATCPFLLHFDL